MKVLKKTTLKLLRDSPGKVRLETFVREGGRSYWLPNLIITDQGAKMYKRQGGWLESIEGGVKILKKEVVEEIEIPDFQSIPYNGPRKGKNGNLSLTLAEKHKIATEKMIQVKIKPSQPNQFPIIYKLVQLGLNSKISKEIVSQIYLYI